MGHGNPGNAIILFDVPPLPPSLATPHHHQSRGTASFGNAEGMRRIPNVNDNRRQTMAACLFVTAMRRVGHMGRRSPLSASRERASEKRFLVSNLFHLSSFWCGG